MEDAKTDSVNLDKPAETSIDPRLQTAQPTAYWWMNLSRLGRPVKEIGFTAPGYIHTDYLFPLYANPAEPDTIRAWADAEYTRILMKYVDRLCDPVSYKGMKKDADEMGEEVHQVIMKCRELLAAQREENKSGINPGSPPAK